MVQAGDDSGWWFAWLSGDTPADRRRWHETTRQEPSRSPPPATQHYSPRVCGTSQLLQCATTRRRETSPLSGTTISRGFTSSQILSWEGKPKASTYTSSYGYEYLKWMISQKLEVALFNIWNLSREESIVYELLVTLPWSTWRTSIQPSGVANGSPTKGDHLLHVANLIRPQTHNNNMDDWNLPGRTNPCHCYHLLG